MSSSLQVPNRITADHARRMVPDIKLKVLEKELTSIYGEIHTAVAHDKKSVDMVSPTKLGDRETLIAEAVNELRKDGYTVEIDGRTNYAVYHISW